MKIYQHIFLSFFLTIIFCETSKAQGIQVFANSDYVYQEALNAYNNNQFGRCIQWADQYITNHRGATEITYSLDKYIHIQSLKYISNLKLMHVQAEADMIQFIKSNEPHPLLTDAIFELADYYYNTRDYQACIDYFEKIDLDALTEDRMSEMVFKMGYCQFVQKSFTEAQYTFSYSKDIKNNKFYPINYYFGMCQYFNGDYEGAVKSFQRVESSDAYRDHIPYYLAQIYFAQDDYDNLLIYGEKVIQNPKTRKIKEIRLLLGQAYFNRGDYARALSHLAYYEAESDYLSVEEFYQLAFVQYKTGNCDEAIDLFNEINRTDSKIGQVSNYYMADCYEKTGDLQSARAAFKLTSQMEYDVKMKQEATFNYGKLSAQMGYEREAINVLVSIPANSPYHEESQSIINDILINTGDYENALSILESLPSMNDELKRTYQLVSFRLGLQAYNSGQTTEAFNLFEKSNHYPYDQSIVNQITFWKAYQEQNKGNWTASQKLFDQYFAASEPALILPQETSIPVASYYQAHNLLKQEKYTEAAGFYKKSIEGINKSMKEYSNQVITQRMLPDAYVRTGDCFFKIKEFDQAKTYYDQTINRSHPATPYALYQRALIEGQQGDPYDKILSLEQVIDQYPNSDYADDAILALGDTYLSLGQTKEAGIAFQKLVDDYEGKTNLMNRAYLKLGLIYYNEGDATGALFQYEQIFKNNPDPLEAQEAMTAIEEIYMEDLSDSQGFIDFVAKVPGYEVSAFEKDSLNYKIAQVRYNNAKYDEAIEGYNAYLSFYANGFYKLDALYHRAECYSLLKRYTEALADYESLIQEGVSDYYERSVKKASIISYNHSQDFQKSFTYFSLLEQISKNKEDQFEAQLGAMRSAFRLGKHEEVLKYTDMVIKNELATQSDKISAKYYLGKASYSLGKLDQANIAFSQVASGGTNNQSAESRYMTARITFEQGDIDRAEMLINMGNEKNTSYPFWIAKNLILLSKIYIKKDDLLNARAALEAVLENFKSNQTIIDEAKVQLEELSALEAERNRIKAPVDTNVLELDTLSNN